MTHAFRCFHIISYQRSSDKLLELFKGACVQGSSNKLSPILPSANFRSFLQDFGLVDEGLSTRDVDLIYVATSGNNHDMKFDNFVIALYEVACRRSKLRQKSDIRLETFHKLLTDVLSNERMLPMYLNATPIISFRDQYSYMRLFYTYEKCLTRVGPTHTSSLDSVLLCVCSMPLYMSCHLLTADTKYACITRYLRHIRRQSTVTSKMRRRRSRSSPSIPSTNSLKSSTSIQSTFQLPTYSVSSSSFHRMSTTQMSCISTFINSQIACSA